MIDTIQRIFKHIFTMPWHLRRYFSKDDLHRIEQAIQSSEKMHLGEIRFAIESYLSLQQLRKHSQARSRALEVFSNLHVWDTQENTGVLIYLLLADHSIEILADRGISKHIAPKAWEDLCENVKKQFHQDQYLEGALFAVNQISQDLAKYFPAEGTNPNELPDKPVIL